MKYDTLSIVKLNVKKILFFNCDKSHCVEDIQI